MLRKMYMKITADQYELPIYYADTIRDLAEMCGVSRTKIETTISRPDNLHKRKEYIVVIYDDSDDFETFSRE